MCPIKYGNTPPKCGHTSFSLGCSSRTLPTISRFKAIVASNTSPSPVAPSEVLVRLNVTGSAGCKNSGTPRFSASANKGRNRGSSRKRRQTEEPLRVRGHRDPRRVRLPTTTKQSVRHHQLTSVHYFSS